MKNGELYLFPVLFTNQSKNILANVRKRSSNYAHQTKVKKYQLLSLLNVTPVLSFLAS